jgi:proteasome lid subunit RPN8/RPN11
VSPDEAFSTVWRRRPQPAGDLRGRYLVPEGVIARTRDALVEFALLGLHDGGHEGLVFWAGLESAELTAFTTVVVPAADHAAQRVLVSERAFGNAVRAARSAGVAILAQVHSHPGSDARHSDGDDDLIVMPFENMLSIVIPRFGVGWTDVFTARVHQYQNGRWVLCRDASVKKSITVSPISVDAR